MTIEDRSIKFYFKDLQLGPKGDPGVSPSISVYDTEAGHRVVILDKDGTKYFNVNNGISPPFTPNPIGNWLFDQEKANLMTLVPSGTFDTTSEVKLDHSRITQLNADASAFSTTRAWFTMSSTPRYLGSSLETTDFENSDFKSFTINSNYNLYCRISGIQKLSSGVSGVNANIPSCYFYIALRNDTNNVTYLTLITPIVGSTNSNQSQFIDYLGYVPLMDIIPENQNVKKIAVAVGVFPGLFDSDLLIDLYLKENEFGLVPNDDRYVMAHCNNKASADRAYRKGDYFIKQNRLYRVLQDISSGGQFVNDVNVKQTNMADEMKEIREMKVVLG